MAGWGELGFPTPKLKFPPPLPYTCITFLPQECHVLYLNAVSEIMILYETLRSINTKVHWHCTDMGVKEKSHHNYEKQLLLYYIMAIHLVQLSARELCLSIT